MNQMLQFNGRPYSTRTQKSSNKVQSMNEGHQKLSETAHCAVSASEKVPSEKPPAEAKPAEKA